MKDEIKQSNFCIIMNTNFEIILSLLDAGANNLQTNQR